MEDLFQIGSIGLIKAIDKFDTGFEVKFSTYAVPMITGEIKRFLRDDGMIKVSRSLKELGFKAVSYTHLGAHKAYNGQPFTERGVCQGGGGRVHEQAESHPGRNR